ncbi:family 2 glycosyl transferase [Streptosporangium sp. NBC_01755]|uniref:glycosyltransferase n=1 Tax=unclassified Streptosporangium TaxID=2632669 RepID=UPI002DD9E204|nr:MULTISPECIES: glycosyltransferase [unclassified Streptosporangium]WSA23933.1 family 2 glycosyl transferase [Streptosporangium sp. NBC_01810]WSC97992.1 family 2 glycosyl transferase [Streptosporangium sp. NBC_01755]
MPAQPISLSPPFLTTPAGFLRSAAGETAELSWTGEGWLAAGSPLGDRPDTEEITRLRPLRGLAVRWPASEVPLGAVTGLAAAGVPLYAAVSPGWVDPELARLLAAWAPEEDDGGGLRSVTALRREEHSVRLRRHGLRDQAGTGRTETAPPTVSVVMSSMRPHLLGSALGQIAGQRRVRVEVLLGLHGVPAAHEDVRRALRECALPVTVVEAGEETPFGEVLNLAASRAGGDYLTKWDDDDWYGPEHLADLLLARSYAGADIVGTAAEFFYLEPLNTTVRRTDYISETWSEHVAGGTILLPGDTFRDAGGFPPLSRGVDAGLLKAAHAAGARVYRTHGLGYVLRRSVGAEHTWRLSLAHFLRVASNQWHGFRPSLILEAR